MQIIQFKTNKLIFTKISLEVIPNIFTNPEKPTDVQIGL